MAFEPEATMSAEPDGAGAGGAASPVAADGLPTLDPASAASVESTARLEMPCVGWSSRAGFGVSIDSPR
jgi:hypothetical protein